LVKFLKFMGVPFYIAMVLSLGFLVLLLVGCSTTNVVVGTPATVNVYRDSVEIKTTEPRTKITVRNGDNPYLKEMK
jgi:hypothetical protein